MSKAFELFITLKIPDTTAITALQVLKGMGLSEINDLKRIGYYRFLVDAETESFKIKIVKADIIVNANKHACSFDIPKGSARLLVKDTENPGEGLLKTLKNRLGFNEIRKVENGTLWVFDTNSKEPKNLAEKAAKELLVNEHFQEYKVL